MTLDDADSEDIEFEFELQMDETGNQIHLVLKSNLPLSPDEYIQAVRKFMDQIEELENLEWSPQVLNPN